MDFFCRFVSGFRGIGREKKIIGWFKIQNKKKKNSRKKWRNCDLCDLLELGFWFGYDWLVNRYFRNRDRVFVNRSFCRVNISIFSRFEINCCVISATGSSSGFKTIASSIVPTIESPFASFSSSRFFPDKNATSCRSFSTFPSYSSFN